MFAALDLPKSPMPVAELMEGMERWMVIGAAVHLIAAHYGLPVASVWSAVIKLEGDDRPDAGACFGQLLERPWGISILGLRVAEALIGKVRAAELPPLEITVQ